MSAPYREPISFEVAYGPRALAEMHRAARPGLQGGEVFIAIALVSLATVIWRGAWHEPASLVTVGLMVWIAWLYAHRSRKLTAAQASLGETVHGAVDDEGVVITSDAGARRWSWERITFAKRTSTALAIFTDADVAIVVLEGPSADLDRIAALAKARARAPWRAPSRWMWAVVLAQALLACIAMRPRTLATPHERIDDALDRRVDPAPSDITALAFGGFCARVDLANLLDDYGRFDLMPPLYDEERAELLVGQNVGVCDDGELSPQGRVIVNDPMRGECTYYAYTIHGDEQWVVVGPYGIGEDAWSRAQPGRFEMGAAIQAVATVHQRWLGRVPSSPPRFDRHMVPDQEDEW